MKESIHIKNLGPIKNILINDIKPITVLIGESGSGKSTLMKTIALFRWLFKMHNIQSYLKRSNISETLFDFEMEQYFENCGFEQFLNNKTQIKYTVSTSEGREYTLEYSKMKLKGTSDENLIHDSDLQYYKLSFISETRNIIPLWSEKGASISGGNLGFYFQEVYNDFVLASENIKKLDVKYLNLKLEVKRDKSLTKYMVQDAEDRFEIDLKNSSSGTQNAIPVSIIAEHFSKHFNFEKSFNRTILTYLGQTDRFTDFKATMNVSDIKKKLFIHIEEPELSLYPDAQCELISDLIDKCFISNLNSVELIFSTHSPYIINHLNLLIKAHDSNKFIDGAKIQFDQLAVYQVEDGGIENLLVQNKRIVNTNPLSDTINSIYDRYKKLQ